MSSKTPKGSSKRSLAKVPTHKESEAFSVAHQNVLLERMEKNIAVIGEGQILLRETVEKNHAELTSQIEGLDRRMGKVEDRLGKVEDRLGKVEDRLGKVEDRLGKVEDRLEHVEVVVVESLERLKSLESRVAALEAKWEIPTTTVITSQDDEERFHQLEQRVAALEARSS